MTDAMQVDVVVCDLRMPKLDGVAFVRLQMARRPLPILILSAAAEDAAEMIDELRGVRLLRGYRGSQPADEQALRDVLLRVSELVRVAPEIQELDLNPVIVLAAGARVADVRMRLDAVMPATRGRRVEY